MSTAPVSPQVARRLGHRTCVSSYHAPLKYVAKDTKGFLRTFFGLLAFLLAPTTLAGVSALADLALSVAEIRVTLVFSAAVVFLAVFFDLFATIKLLKLNSLLEADCQDNSTLTSDISQGSCYTGPMLMVTIAVLCGLIFAASGFFLIKLMRDFRRFSVTKEDYAFSATDSEDLPTVSVCIPARNEMYTLAPCLERVLASDYQRLEIIVLDDGSTDETSHLVKSFASSGVRFAEGAPLGEGWLGKNHALQGLLEQANGDYIIYMDVDTHIRVQTISRMIAYTLRRKKRMVSALPVRFDSFAFGSLLAPLRYFWLVLLGGQKHPPVSTSAWLIDRRYLLHELGGFNGLKLDAQPELVLASHIGDAYGFITDSKLGLSYQKQVRSQIETSLRLLYPILGSHLSRSLSGIALLLLPFVPFVVLIMSGDSVLGLLAYLTLGAITAVYGYYLSRVALRSWWLGMFLWPVIFAQEIILLTLSTMRHLRGTVTWKGRQMRV